MQARSLKAWAWVHKWSSLVSTVFMLVLAVTGAPLIFADEIRELGGHQIEAPAMPDGTPLASLDTVVAAAKARHPGKVPLYLFHEGEHLWFAKLDDRVGTDESTSVFAVIDDRTAQVLGTPNFNQGFMAVVYRLHVDWYAGLPGRLFLGGMGVLMVLAIVSGVVIYAPFMRRLDFGSVRWSKTVSLRWLDWHNLLGILTVLWLGTVGVTGVINSWALPILGAWQNTQVQALQRMAASDGGLAPAAAESVSVQKVMEAARRARPDMHPVTLAFPGTVLSAPGYFAVQMEGSTALTSRLKETVLISARTGVAVMGPPKPLSITTLQLSEPLHFGDYGGVGLKIVWALLDLMAVVVLWSGLVLWWRKHVPARAGASKSMTQRVRA